MVHYHGGLISDDYVIKIIINVLLGTSLDCEPGGDCEFWTIKTLMTDPGRRRGNSELGLDQIVQPSQAAPVTAPTLSLLIISEKIGGNVLDLHRLQEARALGRSHNLIH